MHNRTTYNLSGDTYLTTENGKIAKLHKGEWDIIEDIHLFNETWIKECIRVLSDNGTIWIRGTLHNHQSIGVTLKKLELKQICFVHLIFHLHHPRFQQKKKKLRV